MTRILDTDCLEGRLRVVSTEAQSLRERLAALDKEAEELSVGLRLAERYGTTAPMQSESSGEERSSNQTKASPSNGSSDPTFPEMFEEIIREAKANGRPGATSSEIIAAIRAKWRPDADSDDVRPRLWRLTKTNRLRKKGQYYDLPPNHR